MTQPFCCDITSGTTEEQNEFKRLYDEATKVEHEYNFVFYGFDRNLNENYFLTRISALKWFTRIIPLSEGISILKKMVGEEEKAERTYSLNEVREIALEYRNACLYAHSHNLTRFELQSELIKINQKYNLDYKEGVDFNQPKP